MAKADGLEIDIGGRIDAFRASMGDAASLADKTVRGIEDRFARANPTFGASFLGGFLGGLTGSLGAVQKIANALNEAHKNMVALGDAAKYTGLRVEELSRIRFAASRSGVDESTFNTDARKAAELLNEARREENSLTKLLDANNIKYKDRNGEVIKLNQLLEIAARLIQNAATELDKVKIAEMLGLSEAWVKALENGPEAFRALTNSAAAAGAEIQQSTIDKAKEFDKAWNDAWEAFRNHSKEVISDVFKGIGSLISEAAKFLQGMRELQNYRVTATNGGIRLENPIDGVTDAQGNLLGSGRQVYNEPIGPNRPQTGSSRSRSWDGTVPGPSGGSRTVIPTSGGGGRGGGGGSETSDADKAQARLEKYIETLMRQEAVEKAIQSTIGQSRAAQQAAIEIAKAQVDLSKLDEATRKRITEQLAAQVRKLEEQRGATERLKQAQQAYNDLVKTAGGMAIDAIDKLAAGGANLNDVLSDIARNLGKMFLQAALLGQGPLAQLFGGVGAAQNGAAGGLFGMLFNGFGGFRARGGDVEPGKSYIVGEEGPEVLQVGARGRVIPNDVASRGMNNASVTFAPVIDNRGADVAAVARLERVVDRMNQEFAAKTVEVVKRGSNRRVFGR